MAKTDAEIIGQAIRRVRKLVGADEAEIERRAAVRPGTLAKIEAGELHPRWGIVRRISYALEVSVAEVNIVAEEIEAADQWSSPPADAP